MVANNEVLQHVFIGTGTFRNFSGIVGTYNKTGERKFSVFLPEDIARDLMDIGWYVKEKAPYREGGDPQFQLDIAVGYDRWPPVVKLTSYDGTVSYLTEENVGILDSIDIEDATVEIRPYNWEVNGKSGCKAYLKELVVVARPPRSTRDASLR